MSDELTSDDRSVKAEREKSERTQFLADLKRREAEGFPDVDLSKLPPGPPNAPEPPDERPVA